MLKEVTLESKRHSKLYHLLVLASRILALLFLVLAFAKPFIPSRISGANNKKSKKIAVFLDNSFSMEQQGKRGVVFDQAANYAQEISRVFKTTDRFKLLTGSNLGVPGYYSLDEFAMETHNSKIEGISVPFSEVVNGLTETIDDEKADEIFIVSDFQTNVADLEKWATDTTRKIYLVPVQSSSTDNIFVDSCWFESPVMIAGETIELHYRLSKNYDGNSGEIPVKLLLDGKPKSAVSVSFEGKSQDFSIKFTLNEAGNYAGQLEIADFPVTYDDKLFFTFAIRQKIDLLVVNGNSFEENLMKYFRSDSTFVLSQMSDDAINFSELSRASTLVLNGLEKISSGMITELKKYVESGGKLIVIPAQKISLADYNSLNEALSLPTLLNIDTTKIFVSGIDYESAEYGDIFEEYKENIDWPYFSKRLVFNWTASKTIKPLVYLRDNSPLMFSSNQGSGLVYYFTASFNSNSSNFTRHALFVPLLYKLVIIESFKSQLYNVIGKDTKIAIRTASTRTSDETFVLRKKGSDFSFMPRSKVLGFKTIIDVDGISFDEGTYELLFQDSLVGLMAFNYNRLESQLKSFSESELNQKIEKLGLKNVAVISDSEKGLKEKIAEANDGKQLWKLFLFLALGFLLIEVLLLRFLK